MKKTIVLLIGFSIGYLPLFGQAPKIKDDPQSRVEFEFRKLRNPASGKMPRNIRSKELAFAEQKESKLVEFGARFAAAPPASTWVHRGPFNVGGRTRALAVDVNNENVILAGGVSGGLWRSTDGGSTWAKSTSVSDLQSITCIAQDPRVGETDTWYYGTGELSGNSASGNGGDGGGAGNAFFLGDGVYKSTDGGSSWSLLASTESGTPEAFESDFDINNEIIVNPTNGDVLVANFSGIFRSTNGGTSFTEVLSNTLSGWTDIATTSTGVLYATLEGIGLYKSTNAGANWTNITDPSYPSANGDRIEIAIAPSNEDIVYVLGEDGSDHTLWKYDDNGGGVAIWTDLTAQIPMLGGRCRRF